MNLVKAILDMLFSGDVLGRLSSLLGTDEESAKKATSAAVPALLSGLAGMASSDSGADKLASTFNGLDLNNLGNPARLLANDADGATQKGGDLLSSLFGEGLYSSIASAVGRYAGLDPATAKKLLAMIGPSAIAVLAGQWKSQGGGINGLMSLLAGQQKNIAAALPSGFSLASIPGLPSAEGALRVAGQSASAMGKKANNAAQDAESSALKWVAGLAVLALILGGLWIAFGNQIIGAPEVAKNTADNTIKALKPALPSAPAAPDLTTITNDVSGIFTSATQALGSITDADSAQAALPKLTEVSTKIDGVRDYLDKLPTAVQATLGDQVGKQFAPLKEQAAKVKSMPNVSDKVKEALEGITNKLAGLNLAQVSKDTTEIFASLTKSLGSFTDAASVEKALPELREVSAKVDGLKKIQSLMSSGGQSMLAKLVDSARGPLEKLIEKVVGQLGADAEMVKPLLTEIVTKLSGLTPAPSKT